MMGEEVLLYGKAAIINYGYGSGTALIWNGIYGISTHGVRVLNLRYIVRCSHVVTGFHLGSSSGKSISSNILHNVCECLIESYGAIDTFIQILCQYRSKINTRVTLS